MGRTIHLAMDATNCSAPDSTGNMVLRSVRHTGAGEGVVAVVLDGEIRSALGMTGPLVASADTPTFDPG